MAQQNIVIGTVDGGTGDTYFDAFTKTEANFTELFSGQGNNAVYLYSESDLPNKTATTWTPDVNIPYILAADLTTTLQCVVTNGSSLKGASKYGYTYTFTGTGAAFTSTDANFVLEDIAISTGTNDLFSFGSSSPLSRLTELSVDSVVVKNCGAIGTFTDMRQIKMIDFSALAAVDGMTLAGENSSIRLVRSAIGNATSATIVCLDFALSTASIVTLDDTSFFGLPGAIGVSGLVNSGNINTGFIATMNNCTFFLGLTPLQNISVDDDIRWMFSSNNGVPNTFPDALASFRGNATETVISVVNTPVLTAGTWTEQQASFFSTDAAGRITYLAENDVKAPTTLEAGLISSGGGTIGVTIYVAVNGTVVTASGLPIEISGSTAQTLSIPWQLTLSQNDYIEMYVENNTNTTNIIVQSATIRVL